MQIDAIAETFQHVFTGKTVFTFVGVVALIGLIAAGILIAHLKQCDPVEGSLNSFILPYLLGALVLLGIVCAAGFTFV